MLFLGVVGILQMTFLPGAVALEAVRYRAGLVQRLMLVFTLSILANGVIVALLVASGLYVQPAMLAIVAAEAIALFLLRRREQRTLHDALVSWLRGFTQALESALQSLRRDAAADRLAASLRVLAWLAAALFAIDSLLWAWQLCLESFGTVFGAWDAVVSWNRWAVEWTRGRVPAHIQYYPQLLPMNWSAIYVIAGNAGMQLFPKAVMPLFFLFTLLVVADWGIRTRSWGIVLGVAFVRYLERKCLGGFLTDGYVDVPVAFFGLVAVYVLAVRGEDGEGERRALWASAAAMTAAGLTKQAGAYLLIAWPFLALAFTAKAGPARWKNIFTPYAAAAAAVLSFYAYRALVIARGADTSNIAYVTHEIHGGVGVADRALRALQSLGVYALLFVLVAAAVPLLAPRYRAVALAVVLPFTAVWAMFFSYDYRNIALALPLCGVVAGLAVETFANALLPRLRRLFERLSLRAVAAVLLAAALSSTLLVSDTALKERQTRLQRQIFSPALNEQLYAYIDAHALHGRIATTYPVEFLPGLEGRRRPAWFKDEGELAAIEAEPDVSYLLVPDDASPAVRDAVARKVPAGTYQLIFESDADGRRYTFARIVRRAR